MALKLSKNESLTDIVSSDDTNPLTTEHPIQGSSVEVQVWLFNDNNLKKYVDVKISPFDSIDPDESNWISLSHDNNGSPAGFLEPGQPLSMEDIEDTLGKPLWVRVTTPRVDDTQNKSDIKLNITGKEYAK